MNAGVQQIEWQAFATSIMSLLAGCKMHLYSSSIPWSATNLIGLYTAAECTYTGYAAVTCTPTVSTNQGSGGQLMWLLQTIFQLSGGTGQTAFGWYLTDTAGTGLIAAGQFDTPFEFVSPGDGFALQTAIGIGNDQQVDQAFSTIGE